MVTNKGLSSVVLKWTEELQHFCEIARLPCYDIFWSAEAGLQRDICRFTGSPEGSYRSVAPLLLPRALVVPRRRVSPRIQPSVI